VHPQIHPGVLREVMLARIAGDVAGALNLAKRCRSCGCWPGPIPSFFLSRVLEWRLDTPSVCLWVCDTRPHVVPRADGGNPLERSNLVIASSGCNRRKGDLRLEEIGWSLIEPTDPGWMGLTDLYSVCGGCCRRHPCLCAAPSGPSREQS
jgi:hypothetical protein